MASLTSSKNFYNRIISSFAEELAFQVADASESWIYFTWTNQTTAEGIYVHLQREEDGGSIVDTIAGYVSSAAASTAYSDYDVIPGATRRYRLVNVDPSTDVASVPTEWITVSASPLLAASATPVAFLSTELAWTVNPCLEPTSFRILQNDVLIATVSGENRSFTDISLLPNEIHIYLVIADRGETQLGSASTDTVNHLLLPPDTISASTNTPYPTIYSSVYWSSGTNAQTYVIERADNGSSTFVELATLDQWTGSYEDYTVSEGGTYQYRVKSINSAYSSNYATADPITFPAPLSVPMLALAATPSSSIQIDITTNESPAASPEFQFEFTPDGGGTIISWGSFYPNSWNGQEAQWQLWGSYAGIRGGLRARLLLDNRVSEWSDILDITSAPSTPGDPCSAGDLIEIRWTTGYNMSEYVGYRVELSVDGSVFEYVDTVMYNAVYYASPNQLNQGHTLTYRLQATNGSYTFGYSSTLTFYPPGALTVTPVCRQ